MSARAAARVNHERALSVSDVSHAGADEPFWCDVRGERKPADNYQKSASTSTSASASASASVPGTPPRRRRTTTNRHADPEAKKQQLLQDDDDDTQPAARSSSDLLPRDATDQAMQCYAAPSGQAIDPHKGIDSLSSQDIDVHQAIDTPSGPAVIDAHQYLLPSPISLLRHADTSSCTLCTLPCVTAVSIQPCGHSFCASCLSRHFGLLMQCAMPLACPLKCPDALGVTANYELRRSTIQRRHQRRSTRSPPRLPRSTLTEPSFQAFLRAGNPPDSHMPSNQHQQQQQELQQTYTRTCSSSSTALNNRLRLNQQDPPQQQQQRPPAGQQPFNAHPTPHASHTSSPPTGSPYEEDPLLTECFRNPTTAYMDTLTRLAAADMPQELQLLRMGFPDSETTITRHMPGLHLRNHQSQSHASGPQALFCPPSDSAAAAAAHIEGVASIAPARAIMQTAAADTASQLGTAAQEQDCSGPTYMHGLITSLADWNISQSGSQQGRQQRATEAQCSLQQALGYDIIVDNDEDDIEEGEGDGSETDNADTSAHTQEQAPGAGVLLEPSQPMLTEGQQQVGLPPLPVEQQTGFGLASMLRILATPGSRPPARQHNRRNVDLSGLLSPSFFSLRSPLRGSNGDSRGNAPVSNSSGSRRVAGRSDSSQSIQSTSSHRTSGDLGSCTSPSGSINTLWNVFYSTCGFSRQPSGAGVANSRAVGEGSGGGDSGEGSGSGAGDSGGAGGISRAVSTSPPVCLQLPASNNGIGSSSGGGSGECGGGGGDGSMHGAVPTTPRSLPPLSPCRLLPLLDSPICPTTMEQQHHAASPSLCPTTTTTTTMQHLLPSPSPSCSSTTAELELPQMPTPPLRPPARSSQQQLEYSMQLCGSTAVRHGGHAAGQQQLEYGDQCCTANPISGLTQAQGVPPGAGQVLKVTPETGGVHEVASVEAAASHVMLPDAPLQGEGSLPNHLPKELSPAHMHRVSDSGMPARVIFSGELPPQLLPGSCESPPRLPPLVESDFCDSISDRTSEAASDLASPPFHPFLSMQSAQHEADGELDPAQLHGHHLEISCATASEQFGHVLEVSSTAAEYDADPVFGEDWSDEMDELWSQLSFQGGAAELCGVAEAGKPAGRPRESDMADGVVVGFGSGCQAGGSTSGTPSRPIAVMSLLCPLTDDDLPVDLCGLKAKQVERAISQLKAHVPLSRTAPSPQISSASATLCLELLVRLSWCDDETRDAVSMSGCIGDVVALMRNWPDCPGLQSNACLLFMALVRGEGDLCTANQWLVAKAGGVEAIAGAMVRFGSNSMLQLSALLSLVPLTLENNMMQGHVCDAVLGLVVRSMEMHAHDVLVQVKGLVLLGVMAQGNGALQNVVRRQLVEQGTVERVCAALSTFGCDSDEVLWAAVFLCSSMLSEDKGTCSCVVERMGRSRTLLPMLRRCMSAQEQRAAAAGHGVNDVVAQSGGYLVDRLAPVYERHRRDGMLMLASCATLAAGVGTFLALKLGGWGAGASCRQK